MPIPASQLAALGDVELARRIAHKDTAAFETLMRRCNARLFRAARAILKDDAEAEDALQEAYLAAYNHIGTFRADATLATWLTRIVINEALGRLRRRKRDGVVVPFAAGTRDDQGEEVTILPDDISNPRKPPLCARSCAACWNIGSTNCGGTSRRIHPARSRGADGRRDGAMPVDSGGDRAHAFVSRSHVATRFAIARPRVDDARCVRLRRRALRSHRCRCVGTVERPFQLAKNDSASAGTVVGSNVRDAGTPSARRCIQWARDLERGDQS